MGATFENLTWDDLCDLMCGEPEVEYDDTDDEEIEDDEKWEV